MPTSRSQRWRRHWRLAVGVPLAVALVVAAFGANRVRALSSSERLGRVPRQQTEVPAGQTDLFDIALAHTIEVTYEDVDYQRMLGAYFREGDKDYVPADITIDGVTLRDVGLRLKGTATLAGLRSATGATAPVKADDAAPGTGADGGDGAEAADDTGADATVTASSLSIDRPEGLPWLVRFDAFVAGQTYQGHSAVALRVAQGRTATTVLNEALSLTLLDDAGDPGSSASYATFRVNGGDPQLRLVIENPDEGLAAEDFAGTGALYKARAAGSFDYVGEDPLDYTASFHQLSGRKRLDLQPIIDLIRWANQADDAAFSAQAGRHVDVEAFARYLAWQNLLVNDDDMAGAGRNYLLWYDVRTDRATVVTWDMNDALGSDTARSPYAASATAGGHVLKDRFLAGATFRSVYERAYRDLYRTYFAGGRAAALLDRIAAVLTATPGGRADTASVASDVRTARAFLAERTAALADDPVVTSG